MTLGLERLTASFPWVAGQVVNEAGTFKVIPFERTPPLVVRDLTQDTSAPTMLSLRSAKFPYSMLDEKMICPRMTISGGFGESPSDPYPVLLFQANFITGGLLLTTAASHSVLDIVGQGQMIRLLSKACRGEAFTEEEVRTGNLDRRNIFPLFDDSWQPDSKPSQNDQPSPSRSTPSDQSQNTDPTNLTWAYFIFSRTSLSLLKSHTTTSLPESTPFISTDDALNALIWRTIARARLARLPTTTASTFTRAVDLRPSMDIPPSYPGNTVTKTTHTSLLKDVADWPLGVVAAQLRGSLASEALRYDTLAQLTLQARGTGTPAAERDRRDFVVMSSWVKVDCCDVDFGLGLGRAEAVRRPMFEPVEGVVYLLPKTAHGEIVAGLCLREDDMERLREDEEFRMFGEYVG